ncbi:23S rRNA (uracil(1939)-C(5))-methyltransferase RlmD [Candidatus Frackibacter sp. WG13]|uniref:23S rRNA (uracil(1939)-C(5))-methyltransferase RlmD n=1 Tax=unclassified Candidatus Frackibacter TaxID=2648818 RepID=UPI00079388BC|nr:MAG: 23S rRNA (uracil1939-C5)-methyltransferase [Candidatus Frackibacter sp. T328-2]SDC79342.1 23S rRNA m(5)U-1939 methyltransferase [Candidatus Frackibacter sp. WG11]SEM92035.1 23S rRNA m(5)U-1939 methyltransferase [Candidatus Frackibacter sp. WG12]SFM01789.1 23S rRNA m(5)U-1939 methyltransferase [Candidatus Frackibacter sp. WG13]
MLSKDRPVKVGEKVIIELENLAYGGDVVGRKEGFAIFVPQGVPGERVKIRVTKVKKNYARGEIIDIVKAAPERVTEQCEVSNDCGGCQLQHIDYAAQLEYKEEIVKDAIERIGNLEGIEVNPVIGMDNPYFYRNKAQFPLGIKEEEVVAGFYAAGSHQIIETQECLIQHQLINRIVRKTLNLINEYEISIYDEEKHSGILRHLIVRVGVCTNQAMLVFVTKDEELPYQEELSQQLMEEIPELISIHQNINFRKTNIILGDKTILLAGQDKIIDYIGKIRYKISPESFFQVNTLQANKLYAQVLRAADLNGEERVIDAYCGIGSISLYLAQAAKKVYGIEVVPQAIADARDNAKLNGINNCDFQVGKVREVLPQMEQDGLYPEVIVVDPPRKGCHEEVLKTFLDLKPDKIIYVSCNPSSLARDLKILTAADYEVAEVQPVDMFPQTYHIETVVKLIKPIS